MGPRKESDNPRKPLRNRPGAMKKLKLRSHSCEQAAICIPHLSVRVCQFLEIAVDFSGKIRESGRERWTDYSGPWPTTWGSRFAPGSMDPETSNSPTSISKSRSLEVYIFFGTRIARRTTLNIHMKELFLGARFRVSGFLRGGRPTSACPPTAPTPTRRLHSRPTSACPPTYLALFLSILLWESPSFYESCACCTHICQQFWGAAADSLLGVFDI